VERGGGGGGRANAFEAGANMIRQCEKQVVAYGVFGEVAREGGSVMAGVPGGASCLAPSTIVSD
jgi:hypothetical protein